MDRSLQSSNVSRQNLSAKCEHRSSLPNLYHSKFVKCHWQLQNGPTNRNYWSDVNKDWMTSPKQRLRIASEKARLSETAAADEDDLLLK